MEINEYQTIYLLHNRFKYPRVIRVLSSLGSQGGDLRTGGKNSMQVGANTTGYQGKGKQYEEMCRSFLASSGRRNRWQVQ